MYKRQLVDAHAWDDRVKLAFNIVNGSDVKQPSDGTRKKLAEKDTITKQKQEFSVTLPSLSREPQPNVINKKSDDEREESFQQNHEQRLEQAYERLRNRHSDTSEIHRKDFANTT